MEWNTETQRHRALFFERTEFTECLCVQYKGLTDFLGHAGFAIRRNESIGFVIRTQ